MNRLQLYFKTVTSLNCVNYEGCRYIKRWVSPTQKEITRRKRRLPPQPEPKRNTFTDWNRNTEIYAFNQRLSENFDTEKLNQAFIHKSYIAEEIKRQETMGIKEPELDMQHNEEFIENGKKITSEVIKKYLSENLPHISEAGFMAFHNYLMSEKILAKASLHIGTKDIILTAVWALTESVNIDQASAFVRDFLIAALVDKDLTELWCPTKPFEFLNDMISMKKKTSIEARLIGQTGKNTILSAYYIGIYADKEFLGSGFGQTIAEAKDVAAANILSKMCGILHSSQPLRVDKKINMST
ncbi:39S ribosomal protein L44, mitochondrial [Habropoda laboriosa]|uniref:Large ribosomal subunit protein mL44 n=1 Tax=Habropoda laboriosa TaxID=597456 RepID=A0A0L7R4W1_9HYME|nr:39S ribosomal protein L44, mitochondrial [Habropoda laboriosa]